MGAEAKLTGVLEPAPGDPVPVVIVTPAYLLAQPSHSVVGRVRSWVWVVGAVSSHIIFTKSVWAPWDYFCLAGECLIIQLGIWY